MNEKVARSLERARRSVAAAHVLASNEFASEAVSRAYFAAFYAAEAALLALGETRSKHSGVVSGFGELVVRQGNFDPAIGKRLASLFDRRNEADYGIRPVPAERAQAAISDAEHFVEAVAQWVARRDAASTRRVGK
ncbi:MAG: HEPN domain-containing protein [Chloroflexi bacterium]|nr:HEPN domain-containing protein [Chloroflexota bacterium]MBI2983786.1 HEPN domain-containing protein [Chloroflexota bacterium]